MKIRIPKYIVAQIPTIAAKIRQLFESNQKKIKTPIPVHNIFLRGKENRFIVISIDERLRAKDATKKDRKKTIACYDGNSDVIFIYRTANDPKRGPVGLEHNIVHEIAHALDRARVRKSGATAKKMGAPAKMTKKYRRYACQDIEFDAEMAAIETIDIPYMIAHWEDMILQFLSANTKHVFAWKDDPKRKEQFKQRLVAAIQAQITYNRLHGPRRRAGHIRGLRAAESPFEILSALAAQRQTPSQE